MFVQLLFVLLATASYASAQNGCAATSAFSRFFKCMKDTGGGSDGFKTLEEGYHDELEGRGKQCFGPSGGDNKCYLTKEQLDTDVFGSNSIPLEHCNTCKVIAKAAIGMIHSVDRKTSKCAGKIIRANIARNIKTCVAAKLNSKFEMPEIPDFDEDGFPHKDLVKKSLSLHINMLYQLSFCAHKNKTVFGPTDQCMATFSKEGSGELTPCKMIDGCMNDQKAACKKTVNSAHYKMCECLGEGADKIKVELEKLGKNLVQSIFMARRCVLQKKTSSDPDCADAFERVKRVIKAHSGEKQPDGCGADDKQKYPPLMCACYWSLRDALRSKSKYGTHTTDWYTVVQKVKNECVDGGSGLNLGGAIGNTNKFTIDKAIFWGCARIVKQPSLKELRDATLGLWTGASFLGHLFDAAIQRVERYCPCE